ncbi:MAG: ABC transporter permease [Tannerellaceae bacterium]|jgi:putative ABC transport system permease protein|nr:ABC transporter permease [Tannerellaceae bacterium]
MTTTVLKNFLSVLKRFQLASFLNIAGLSVAFAAFLVIMIQIRYEWTFDRMHPHADRIFRMDMPRHLDGDRFASVLTRGFVDKVITSSPHIEAGSLLFTGGFIDKTYITVGEGATQKGFKENLVTCYPDIVNIFGFSMVEGNLNCLDSPEKILIPESMARRMFGDEPAIGQMVRLEQRVWTKTDVQLFTVGGVYKDFPENTQVNNVIYTPIDKSMENNWTAMNFLGYVLLDSPQSKEIVEETINSLIDYTAYNRSAETRLDLVPLTDIYYMPGQLTDLVKTGNPNTARLLFLIALLVIVIACINFVNFSTAMAPIRMKGINTRKVLGSSDSSLRMELVAEAVGMSLLACLSAFGIIWALDKVQLFSFMTADVNLLNQLPLVGLLIVLSVLLGILSGLYPSWYMTSFSPALVLKGNFGLSASGRKLRTALIGFQYVVSIGLIICALFIWLQNKYMRSYDTGFNKDRIAVVNIGAKLYNDSKDVYIQRLKEYTGIEDVAFSFQEIGRTDIYASSDILYKEQRFNANLLGVSWNFLDVMGIPVVSGRNFRESDARDDSTAYHIYNQSIQKRLNMAPGDRLDPEGFGRVQINGFVNNIKISSLRNGEDDIAFIVQKGGTLPFSYIRIRPEVNIQEAVEHIRRTVAEIDPAYPFNIEFYDTIFGQLYHKEESLNRLVSSFGLLAIILCITGVFGLVIFETQYRRKEIGVRKVFGATVGEILLMFNKIYIRIILVCFIIAAPVAFYAVSKWLETFYYRTPIHWWVFAVAFVVVTMITLFTVSFQNWRTANENPVDSIKTE